ncbi:MAG: hypothetical protein E7329_03945 [Clostridiales bacterium]|nr:hypothetical protein [Clostridiales bacterium]
MKKFIAILMALVALMLPGLTLAEEIVEAAGEAMAEAPLSIGESLMYMLKGMVGIFLVTAMIILVLVILEKATKGKKEE